MKQHNLSVLKELLQAHSTPGDEGEVASLLTRRWKGSGLQVSAHGHYAVSASLTSPADDRRPVLLMCAHMDSPGFAVDAIFSDRLRLTTLGGAHFEAGKTSGRLKTSSATVPVMIRQENPETGGRPVYWVHGVPEGIRHGDRVCFAREPDIAPGGEIVSPFLDNRLGCWVLCELAAELANLSTTYRVVLGATACEEMGGFGAPVLAAAVRPAAVICLDATYEAEEQGVVTGGGPTLTLSDASVLLSPACRDRVMGLFADHQVPLQTEVYNFSGTDSRAFPHAGLPAPVYPLLIPTRGNHTPVEEGHLADAAALLRGLAVLAEHLTPEH